MRKQSIVPIIILMTLFIILAAGIAGCSSQAPSASTVPAITVSAITPSQALPESPTAEKKMSTIEPAEMAIQPSDFPVNVTLLEKGARNISEMRNWSLDQGWKKGYYAAYVKNDPKSPSGTVFDQALSVYPADNITLIVPNTVGMWKNWSAEEKNVTVEELPLPTIGDSSVAMRATDKRDNTQEYLITFVKYDVYEEFWTNGTATDYETLKQLAGSSAAKIK
jgi:hypothetical protein